MMLLDTASAVALASESFVQRISFLGSQSTEVALPSAVRGVLGTTTILSTMESYGTAHNRFDLGKRRTFLIDAPR